MGWHLTEIYLHCIARKTVTPRALIYRGRSNQHYPSVPNSFLQTRQKKETRIKSYREQENSWLIVNLNIAEQRMGFIHENINKSTFSAPANAKHVTFGKVHTLEYVKEEPKVSMKKKIVGFLDNAMTIGNDENLKILIKNQTFWLCQERWMRPTTSIIVKPWPQTPKPQTQKPKNPKRGLGLTLKSHGPPPPHPTHNF